MAHQDHQVAEMVSEDVNDERRLYECARKYETIVRQFDELVGLMNNGTSMPKWPKSRRGNASGGRTSVSTSQPNNNEALVQTVTRFLHELRVNPTDLSAHEAHKVNKQ
ncbi:hypothetical protein VNO77_16172 [Canavalia gladiata]|uniref:Uncharacterized protein n=1 Tax=Canavalia gladiata TaxID=3824 RepID=A0AAN9M0J9_CANGL